MKTPRLLFALILAASSIVVAGKPWRPALEQLVPESALIVVGNVTRIEPSLVKDKDGHPYSLAIIRVTETLKGTPPKTLLVTVPAEPIYDEKGIQLIISSAYLYDLKQVDHSFVLFLTKPADATAIYYVPAGLGSGIVDLNRDRAGDGPAELERLRAFPRGK